MSAVQLDPNYIYGVFKIGDQLNSKVNKYAGIKDQMIDSAVDPQQWGQTIFLSDWMQIAFCMVKFNRSWGDQLFSMCKPIYDSNGKVMQRKSSGFLSFDELQTSLNMSNLINDLRLKNTIVPILDGTGLSQTILKDASKYSWNGLIKDNNAVSSGSHTVGPVDATYLLWSAASSDTANLTDPLTFTQTGATNESSTSDWTINLNSNRLKLTSNSDHKGDITKGHKTTYTTAQTMCQGVSPEGPGIFEVDKLYPLPHTTMNANWRVFETFGVTTGFTFKLHNTLFDGRGITDNSFGSYDSNAATVTFEFWNNKIWNFKSLAWFIIACDASSKLENNTLDGASITSLHGFSLNTKAIAVTNNASINCTNDYADHSAAIAKNNLSKDASSTNENWGTGTGNIPNATPEDEFASLTIDSDYLKIKEDATNIKDGGVAPAISDNTAGIEGHPRPQLNGDVSIGCHEFSAPCLPTSKTSITLGIRL